jgi:hypothetical protein
MSRTLAIALDALPLYASDEQIGAAVLGRSRAREFCDLVTALEREPGFPRIDLLMGGRYVPAVRRFLDMRHGVIVAAAAAVPDGREGDGSSWNTRAKKRRA